MRLRLGRLLLRTHGPYYFRWLPRGYRMPSPVYAVEWRDSRDGSSSQLGVFTTEADARACMARLVQEGWKECDVDDDDGLYINFLAVHERLKDWEWDR